MDKDQTTDFTYLDIATTLDVERNGYAYIYFSNESDKDVYFDIFNLTHVRGPLIEENHYYPFGLTMSGISSKALNFGEPENKRKFNKGSELQNKEFTDGSGLEWHATQFRNLDPQLGRWWQIDPKSDYAESPYASMGNNPILHNDALGDTAIFAGTPSAQATTAKVANSGLGGFYNASISKDGKLSLTPLPKTGVINSKQQALLKVLKTVNSDPKNTNLSVVGRNDATSQKVVIGDNGQSSASQTPGTHTLNVGDMHAKGSTGVLIGQGALGHEIQVGYDIQVKGMSPLASQGYALSVESNIDGIQRPNLLTPLEPQGAVNQTLKVTIIDAPMRSSGNMREVIFTVKNGNITGSFNNY